MLVIIWVDYRPIDDGYRCLYMMLIHESQVFELWSETKFEVCDSSQFFNSNYAETRKALKSFHLLWQLNC